MIQNPEAICGNCPFSVSETTGSLRTPERRRCRLYPPHVTDWSSSAFPVVSDEWWCGQHPQRTGGVMPELRRLQEPAFEHKRHKPEAHLPVASKSRKK